MRLRGLLPLALLVIAMASIQAGAALAKSLFTVLAPEGVTALRITLAALLLLIVWRPWRSPPSPRARPWILVYGVALGTMNLLFYLAIARIPLGVAVALEFTGPLAVAMLGSRRLADLLWAGLAAAGVAMLSPLFAIGAPLDPIGVLLALAAGACWGLYIVFGQKAGGGAPGSSAALGMTVAALVAAPVGAAVSGSALLNLALLPAALGVAVLSSALPYSLEMFALSRIDRRVFGIAMSLEPAVAAVAGLVLLHEGLSAIQACAIVLVMAASLGCALASRPSLPAPGQP